VVTGRITDGVRVFHVAITRGELLRELHRRGPEAVLAGFTGTVAEAERAIAADRREHFVLDPACDRQDRTGRCLGHPRPRCPQCGGWLSLSAGPPQCPLCGEV
jgi:hypothetical protein